MKKIALSFITFICALQLNAQDTTSLLHRIFRKQEYQAAAGFVYNVPWYGFSARYAISRHSALQALVAPHSELGGLSLSFYGGRYVYSLSYHKLSSLGSRTVAHPYAFAEAGKFNWKYDYYGPNFEGHFSGIAIGYFLGAGYEVILARHFAVSLEAAYGVYSTIIDIDAFSGGGGLHYYF